MKTTAFRKNLAVIFLLALSALSGCARVSPVPDSRPLSALRREVAKIGGVNYLPAVSVCEAYGINWQWDAISSQLTLQKDSYTVILRPDTNILLLNGESVHLKHSPVIYKGILYLPYDLVASRLDVVFYKRHLIPEKRGTYGIDTIVIDPGHGGKDPGAIGPSGLYEKDVVLDISKRLRANLERHGINVILTRETDRFISLWERANIANRNNADFFISIHANASRSRVASGFEVYYLSEASDDLARAVQAAENAALDFETGFPVRSSAQLKTTLWDIIITENRIVSIELAEALCEAMEKRLDSRNRGVKSALFYVLKGARSPSVLAEVAFLSNREEETRLRNSSYRQRIADALTEGILNYKRRYELTDGFTN
jgi:N-acetylmuramoyl-L-alanine amidase